MAIYIKNPETDRAARLLARRTGRTLTEAIDDAVQDRLARLDAEGADTPATARFDAAVARLQQGEGAIYDVDDLYDDETGLPR